MTREAFKRRYSLQWSRLEKLLHVMDDSSKSKDPEKYIELYGDADLAEFSHLYRMVCKHLALARQRMYGTDLVDDLNALALRAHQRLYGKRSGTWSAVLRFIASDFPASVRAHSGLMLTATLLFVLPTLGLAFAVHRQPDLIYSVMDVDDIRRFEEMYDPGSDYRSRERASDSDMMMFGYYISNNISVAFRTFAGGILFGIGSVLLLVLNGALLGAVAAHVQTMGYGQTFFPFVIGHASFELTAIILAGAAGLNLGWALIAPGRETRSVALKTAARDSVKIIYGVGAMLLAAAFIEAFWSSTTSIAPGVRYAVGAMLWTLVLAYLLLAGRR